MKCIKLVPISILMSGYIEKEKMTSLRGTLVPATTINKTIAKIPLLEICYW